jgi:hypothetical protein
MIILLLLQLMLAFSMIFFMRTSQRRCSALSLMMVIPSLAYALSSRIQINARVPVRCVLPSLQRADVVLIPIPATSATFPSFPHILAFFVLVLIVLIIVLIIVLVVVSIFLTIFTNDFSVFAAAAAFNMFRP